MIDSLIGKKVILLYSGGMDSTACLHILSQSNTDLNALYIDFGNISAKQEIKAAKRFTSFYNVPFNIVTLKTSKKYYKGEIIGRNAFLILTALMSYSDVDYIVLGIHNGTDYYDCSSLFINRIEKLVEEYTNGRTQLLFPFKDIYKKDIYEYLKASNIQIDKTYSCETGKKNNCGHCRSCIEREKLVSGI